MEQVTRDHSRRFWRHLAFAWFVVAILCLCFAYGVAVGKWRLFPYGILDTGLDSLRDLANRQPPHFIHPARYEGEGVVVYEPGQVLSGVTLVAGICRDVDNRNVGIRLIDLNGKILHQWQITSENLIKSDTVTEKETFLHGTLLLPRGDVIFNLSYIGLVRLNAQSEVVWKLAYPTHHSIFQDDAGSLWVCGNKRHEDSVAEFPGLRTPLWEDTILKVSTDGIVEREISVLQTIYKSGYYSLIHTTNRKSGDILHLNDVEVLSERMADAFDLFEAGDIMVSMRDINAVFVIDGETERIKWCMTHPFIAQHDPDFTESGHITVFDNHLGGLGGSRILRIEPSTREVEVLYGHKNDQYFYTLRCGAHQHLPNGNMLVTESYAGRVFEVTADGRVVWSWIAWRWDKNFVPEVLEGTRYGLEYANFIDRGN